jgi:hypothetical protein
MSMLVNVCGIVCSTKEGPVSRLPALLFVKLGQVCVLCVCVCVCVSLVCFHHDSRGSVGEGTQQQGQSVVAMSLRVGLEHHLYTRHISLYCCFTSMISLPQTDIQED